ncbi:hypothetical protein D918_03719 [Trichuris suis]|nr:hypothetical protein D918_03719 [Trichuris suis]
MRSIHVSTSGEVYSSDSEENNQILESGNASCSFGDDRRTDNASTESADREILREQDRFLPIANVARLMKRGVPETGKIAKDAKECCQESVSEFISFLTSEAAERSLIEKRKTINGEDLLVALDGLGFEPYVDYMRGYLEKYRVACKTEKTTIDNIAPFVVRQKPLISNIAPATG